MIKVFGLGRRLAVFCAFFLLVYPAEFFVQGFLIVLFPVVLHFFAPLVIDSGVNVALQ